MKETKFGNNPSDKHFHMSDGYERHSESQQTIGKTVIESTADFAKLTFAEPKELNVLDLACGPGNLTIELKKKLETAFHGTKIKLAGLDYTKENVDRLVEKSGSEIQGIVGSFYKLPAEAKNKDIITSNEGLHWQPPYEMSEIIYSQLPPEEKERYESWALENFKTAMKNIYESLKEGGIAVLQFGHEGQLQKSWDLIRNTLNEKQFKNYKSKVNYPLYCPTEKNIKDSLLGAGFLDGNIEINGFNQDLTENTPESIAGFFEAVSRPNFSTFFKPDDLDKFYTTIKEKLAKLNIDEFRKDQWHRTLIKAKK